MSLAKQAKILTKGQIDALLALIANTRNPERNRVIALLSIRAGLRAKEIASLKWAMVTDAEGVLSDSISLTDGASKGRSGRTIPLAKDLRAALSILKAMNKGRDASDFVIRTERSPNTSSQAIVNLFAAWYSHLGYSGASSHSGRRTAITNWARKISTVGGSLRDVQLLAGHSALGTTQRYIEANEDAKRRVVELV
jgi:integrase/recombinase XerD